jgi:hypothetical protein
MKPIAVLPTAVGLPFTAPAPRCHSFGGIDQRATCFDEAQTSGGSRGVKASFRADSPLRVLSSASAMTNLAFVALRSSSDKPKWR